MGNELVEKNKNEMSIIDTMMDEFNFEQVSSKDLKIPKILLMQLMSKFVSEGDNIKAGDLVNSVTGEVFGSVREKDYSPVRIVPLHMFKQWVVHELVGNEKKFKEIVPVTPLNEGWEWEYTDESGRKFRRTYCINFYVINEKDLGNKEAFPYVITFRNTSTKGASALTNHFALCKIAQVQKTRRPPFDRFFEIGGKSEKNDKGTFFVLSSKECEHVPTEYWADLMGWYRNVSKLSHMHIDQSDIKTEEIEEF